jgi:hypothetical protein
LSLPVPACPFVRQPKRGKVPTPCVPSPQLSPQTPPANNDRGAALGTAGAQLWASDALRAAIGGWWKCVCERSQNRARDRQCNRLLQTSSTNGFGAKRYSLEVARKAVRCAPISTRREMRRTGPRLEPSPPAQGSPSSAFGMRPNMMLSWCSEWLMCVGVRGIRWFWCPVGWRGASAGHRKQASPSEARSAGNP